VRSRFPKNFRREKVDFYLIDKPHPDHDFKSHWRRARSAPQVQGMAEIERDNFDQWWAAVGTLSDAWLSMHAVAPGDTVLEDGQHRRVENAVVKLIDAALADDLICSLLADHRERGPRP
jgi:hypothetical protein